MTARPSAHPPWLVLAFLLYLLFSGCGSPRAGKSESPVRRIHQRLISETPTKAFDLEEIASLRVVASWSFESPDDIAGWKLRRGGTKSRVTGNGWRLVPDGTGHLALIREVDFEASAVDRIEVEISGVHRGTARLLWTGPGQKFERARSLRVNLRWLGEENVSFDLRAHPEWAGRIEKIRLEPSSLPGRPVTVHRILATRYELEEDLLAARGREPKRVELDHVVRDGVIVAPGSPWTQRVDIPAASVLEVYWGRPFRGPPFEIEILIRVGEDVSSIHRSSLDRPGLWSRASVDLKEWEGTNREIVFRTVGSDSTTRPLAFVANPIVLSPAPAGSDPLPSMVLVVVDTLRADRVSLTGHSRPTTPRFDDWIRRNGVYFENAVAPAPWTLPSHISLFSGRDSLSHGLNHDEGAPENLELLAEKLRAAGYSTHAVTGGVYLHPAYGLDQGFDSFRYWPSSSPQEDELSDGIDRALRLIADHEDRPFFLFFHTYEVHSRFREREPYYSEFATGKTGIAKRLAVVRREKTPENGYTDVRSNVSRQNGTEAPLDDLELEDLQVVYDSGVAYMDEKVAGLLDRIDRLRSRGHSVLFALTSDHGEGLGDKGLAGHSYLFDFNLAIPLAVSLPDRTGAGRVESRQVRLIDLAPTLLDAAGVRGRNDDLDGRSLIPLIHDPQAPFPEEAWSYAGSSNFGIALRLGGRLKLTFNDTLWPAVQGNTGLFDLRRDPLESVDQSRRTPDLHESLRQRVIERATRQPGLWIGIENRSEESYRVVVSPTSPSSPKTFHLPPEVSAEFAPGRTTLTLGPASELELRLASEPDGRKDLEIILGAEGGEEAVRCRFSWDPDGLTERQDASLGAEGCAQPAPEDPSSADVYVWIERRGQRAELGQRSADPDLQEKLKSLGYI